MTEHISLPPHGGTDSAEAQGAPPGFVPIRLGKACYLLLTQGEYLQGLRRGKWWRRRLALHQRSGGQR
jgi:hypothetical protein